MKCYYFAILILSFNAIQASVYSSLRENVQSYLQQNAVQTEEENDLQETEPKVMRHFSHHKRQDDVRDKKSAQSKASVIKRVRTHDNALNIGRDLPISKLTRNRNDINKPIGKEYFHMDPVLNALKRRSPTFRRSGSSGESSSLEMRFWMDEFEEHWMQKKFEAVNTTQHRGDVVNMVAARPWGVACGDPNQHDMPWGSCTLPSECDAEYRIYRGDYFCGRSAFVCCSLQLTSYDLYQGIDLSFEDSSFETDSNEKRGSKEDDRVKKKREKSKRKIERDKRKKKIKNSIKQIEKEIKKILSRAYRNGTSERRRKTKELKKFIEVMKKKFKKDRKSVVDIHEYELVKLDENMQSRLDQIKHVNEQFMSNDTFRDLVVNGTLNKEKLLLLLRAFPDIKKVIRGGGRRADVNVMDMNVEENEALKVPEKKKDLNVLEYDIEYGQLYF